MRTKSIQEMERSELIGMVKALQRQIEDLTGPERTRLYQLGRLASMAREDEQLEEPEQSSFWQRLTHQRAAS